MPVGFSNRRDFRRPEDVARALDRLGQEPGLWEDAPPIVTALMSQWVSGFHVAWRRHKAITGGIIADDEFSLAFPIQELSTGAAFRLQRLSTTPYYQEAIKAFWGEPPGVLARNATPGQAEATADDNMTGWYFVPEHIILKFFTAGSTTPKASRIDRLQTDAGWGPRYPSGAIPARDQRLLLAVGLGYTTNYPVQVFSVNHDGEEKAPIRALIPWPHFQDSQLWFEGLNGLAELDSIQITVLARYYFNPRYIRPDAEPKR